MSNVNDVLKSPTVEPAIAIARYLNSQGHQPLFVEGDAASVLAGLPASCIDCTMSSPPYWGQRSYAGGGIGLEESWREYIDHLLAVFRQVKRVLKSTGSFWLNIGDAYERKNLIGLPWRVALAMTDRDGWTLRNSVIWNKVKGGPDNAKDKLRNVHENLFHFVKDGHYFYDADAIRSKPGQSKVVNGSVVSATGVSGVRYRRQIELSTALSNVEKDAAFKALDAILEEVRMGTLADFRMIIRGQQRATHSDSERVSGRARELTQRGFYFLKYDPNGAKPSDVWDILPEDTQKRTGHFAPYPEDLCKMPICATCPDDGVVLDPFSGSGTTSLVAFQLGRKSIGIDISAEYVARRQGKVQVSALTKVAELYGLPTFQEADWMAVTTAQQCPFLSRKCLKNRKSDPDVTIGTCTMTYGHEATAVMICPFRLLERSQIFTDCLHLLTLHEPGNELRIIPELNVPGGSIDYCLVSVRDGKPRDFVGIELQTIDSTGTVWPERQRFLRTHGIPVHQEAIDSPKRFGMNWKMTAKTVLVQLHHKITTFEHLRKHLVLVMQDCLLDYVRRRFNFGHVKGVREGDSMHFHAYELKKSGTGYRLDLKERVSTDDIGIGQCLGLQVSAKVELRAILQQIESKLPQSTLLTVRGAAGPVPVLSGIAAEAASRPPGRGTQ